MPKFTFKSQFPDYDEFTGDIIGTKCTTTVEFEAEELREVISEFENFLRGSGFRFDGNLEIVDAEIELKKYYFTKDNSEFEENAFQSSLPKANEKVCNVCGINRNIMMNHQCFDKNCPKEHWNKPVNLASEK